MEVKDVCFVRHAKSDWDHPGLADHERPLDSRGRHDAPLMAKKMHQLGLIPDMIITSGAVRARDTADFFRKEFDLDADHFMVTDRLYEASPETIYEVLREAPDSASFVYVFGHNPAMTWVANSISGVHIDNVPTCGVVHVQTIIHTWKKFKPEHAGFIGFHYPKQYKH